MKSYKITLVPGDGTGPELMAVAREIIEKAGELYGFKFEWDEKEAGIPAYEKYGDPLPKETIESIRRNKILYKGPITTPVGVGYRSVNVAIRKMFKLYAIVRPAKSIPRFSTRYSNVDLIVVREGTEEFYAGIEHRINTVDRERIAAESIGIVTRETSEKVIRFSFEYAKRMGRRRVSAVHKANILKESHGLFRDIFYEVAEEYPDIQADDYMVDNMAYQLVTKPEIYDVLVTPNLVGDILSDLASGLVGSLGIVPSGNIGDEYAMFEPIHGSAPKYAGQNKVNPTAQIMAGVMMLQYLNEMDAANLVQEAVFKVIEEGKYVTYDIARVYGVEPVGTREMGKEIIRKMEELYSGT
ncbi:TPA: isocitrate/isopropylmalate dehydrogenase family protein [Candidatus Geothermarchaeota archaeon]|nr:isocitrate/isopropylmalate dehydrogenase family protein [Candidatus Geothermarchaeota archaeon]HIQ13465.1 isocitrate/isopropylmalate dehydrogenase family protein [Thermoprotei archaeon]